MSDTFWDRAIGRLSPATRAELEGVVEAAARRLPHAGKATGTVSLAACLCLRALCERAWPLVAAEIGTYIGTSTFALRAGHVYTCDQHHGCVESSPTVTSFPFTRSTVMLTELVGRGLRVDLFFFDGRIQDADRPLLAQLATPWTVFAVDDYVGDEKGVWNMRRLRPLARTHALLLPPARVAGTRTVSTVAALVPEAWA